MLRGCPSDGRCSECESDWCVVYQLWMSLIGLVGCFRVCLILESLSVWWCTQRASMMLGCRFAC